jgi:hypothetical protein
MKRIAILTAAIGIWALAACATNPEPVTPTVEPTTDPVLNATEGADTTTDSADSTLGDQDAQEPTFSASVSGGESFDLFAPGRFACLPPTTQEFEEQTTEIPGTLQISGLDAEFRLLAVNLPFDPELGEHPVDPSGGIGVYSIELTLDPSDPNSLYRATSGTITIDALPVGTGDRVAGSFSGNLQQVAGDAEDIAVSGEFDFLTDDTSTLCPTE